MKMTTTHPNLEESNGVTTMAASHKSNPSKALLMRQLQLVAHGEPSDVIELNTVPEPALGREDVFISMEAAPINPSDFLYVRGMYGVRPAFPSPVGAEGVGRVAKIGSKVDVALQGKRVLIIPTYEQGTWADQVVAPVRNIVPMSDEADPLQLSMIGINPVSAYLLLSRYVSLMPGDWIGQTAANSAMGQYIIKFAKLDVADVGFLVNTGKQLILVDAGAGTWWGGGAFGRLAGSLRSAGYTPEEVDIVLVTHLHSDHVGGLTTQDGKRVFPNADVYVAKAESDFWLSPCGQAHRGKNVPAG